MSLKLPNPASSKSRKFLLISPTKVWDDTSGSNLRIRQVVSELTKNPNNTIYLVQSVPDSETQFPFWKEVQENLHISSIGRIRISSCNRLKLGPFDGRVSGSYLVQLIQEIVESVQPELVYWFEGPLAYYGIKGLEKNEKSVQVVEFANVEKFRYRSLLSESTLKSRLINGIEYLKSLHWESQLIENCDGIVSLSLHEVKYLESKSKGSVHLFENELKIIQATHSRDDLTLLSVGSWWYQPNRIGLEKFIKREWPKVLLEIPDAKLVVAGNKANTLKIPRGARNIEILGFVQDLGKLYASCSLVLAPAQTGGGSQLKVSEALSHMRIVVGPKFVERSRPQNLPEALVNGTGKLHVVIVRLLQDTQTRNRLENELRIFLNGRVTKNESQSLENYLLGLRKML
jgi:hypothetical protein